MFVVTFEKLGNPAEVLRLREVEVPAVPAGSVLIRVKASPVNPSDVMFVRGLYGIRPQLPSGAGFEGAGIVEALGEGVSASLLGKRVMFTTIGAWAEYVVVPAKTAILIPETLSDEIACQAFVNPFTAWAMLHEANLQAGDWLLLTAGGSTFGQLIVQMARKRGIRTICTVRRNDQIEQLKALGATEVLNTEEVKLAKAVYEITQGKGADCCLEAVGGKTASDALKALKIGGVMLVYGLLSLEAPVIDTGLMIFRTLTIKGFWLTSWLAHASREVHNQLKTEVFELLSQEVKITIEATYSLHEIHKAVQHAETPGRKGKILIVNP
ncbi:MAG: zinc-dependent alcohol dehydrogenase family protein [Microscillaceae bacterium]|nr:zinc-dependent alcohol dehydrogenase family protein [Microscillaceae bacterium]MDW8459956.1 zinc-dependent alcohol dehydrogenase family protein [Cytophagales bacterium]